MGLFDGNFVLFFDRYNLWLFDRYACSAFFLTFLEANVVFDQKLNELSLVVL
jgi:hypothetical protein